ncbi:hypothetical protein A5792_25755 [Mycolicibacterium peregrinum]|uniref:DNA-binding protein n=1 Tax=Mycolicibacterium peregrinum TaxID=43304 RepID=A0A1A0QYQ6_MYCPR|nr:OB-fold domain-containing protein [Mycolicibacterium peregrinum]OBB27212.1 hypothetical protein A5792_25755 [Mycolicibacterium peregrinum]
MTDHPLADADSAPWWDALERGELLVQDCARCRRLRWPARVVCGDCSSLEWNWVAASGRGTIASWTVGHRPGVESAPSVVVMVRLEEQDDLLVPGYIDGPADGRGLRIGQSVDVGFDDVEFGSQGWRVAVLRWRRR